MEEELFEESSNGFVESFNLMSVFMSDSLPVESRMLISVNSQLFFLFKREFMGVELDDD